ncbi:hypothetical protein NQZ68_033428 [Dissostichus eleginoides]|nr:hypothetical protein NQZ68_033428 [Dissostichus eleginoides]
MMMMTHIVIPAAVAPISLSCSDSSDTPASCDGFILLAAAPCVRPFVPIIQVGQVEDGSCTLLKTYLAGTQTEPDHQHEIPQPVTMATGKSLSLRHMYRAAQSLNDVSPTRPLITSIFRHLEALCVTAVCHMCIKSNEYKLSPNTPEIEERPQQGQFDERFHP